MKYYLVLLIIDFMLMNLKSNYFMFEIHLKPKILPLKAWRIKYWSKMLEHYPITSCFFDFFMQEFYFYLGKLNPWIKVLHTSIGLCQCQLGFCTVIDQRQEIWIIKGRRIKYTGKVSAYRGNFILSRCAWQFSRKGTR